MYTHSAEYHPDEQGEIIHMHQVARSPVEDQIDWFQF